MQRMRWMVATNQTSSVVCDNFINNYDENTLHPDEIRQAVALQAFVMEQL
jgi:hypothetical protein